MNDLARTAVAALDRRQLLWPVAVVTGAALAAGIAAPGAAGWLVAAVAGVAVLTLAFAEPRWVLVVQFALVASYAVYVLQGRAGLPIAPSTLVLLVLLGAGMRRLVGADTPELPWREIGLLAALGVVIAVSAVFASDPEASRATFTTYAQNAVFVGLAVYLLDRPAWLRRGMWGFVAGAGFLAVLAVAHQLGNPTGPAFGGFADVELDARGLTRSSGPLNSNFFGEMLVATTALAVYLGLSASRRAPRVAGFALACASVAAIWFTYSRAAVIAAAVVLVLIAILRRVRLRVLAAAAVAAAIAVAAVGPDTSAVEDHFGSLFSSVWGDAASEDVSVSGRQSENIAALRMFRDHPLLGVGAGNYPTRYLAYSEDIGLDPRAEARSPHSLYLQVVAETGFVGAVVFAALLGTAIVGAWRARKALAGRDALLAEGASVALVGFLVNAVFLHLSYENYFWMVLAIALSAGRLGRTASRAGREAGEPALERG